MKFKRYLQNIKEPDKDKLKKEMKNQNYMQEIEMTDEENIEMYKKCSAEDLAKMYVELEKVFKDILKRYENCEERYIENENFLLEYLGFGFFKQLFKGKKLIVKHFNKILVKYDF